MRLLSSPGWQLPWLRVSLILRTLAGQRTEASRNDANDERESLLRVQRKIIRAGWFN